MTAKECYLSDETTVPVAVFGGSEDLTFAVEVTFPELPLLPETAERSVEVR